MERPDTSHRSRLVALLLCFIFGTFGAHRFYVGKIGTAILMVITVGGFGIWATIDLIMILVGAFTDEAGRPLREWVPEAGTTSDTPESDLEGRMDRIDSQLTDLQGVLIDMTDKLDRRQYGHLV